jgi:hypothetical protein
MKTYNFYGWEQATVPAITNKYKGIHTPQDLYDRLSDIWCADTCASRLRDGWTPENKTLGSVLSQHFWFRTSLAARCMASCVPAETIIAITMSTVIYLT